LNAIGREAIREAPEDIRTFAAVACESERDIGMNDSRTASFSGQPIDGLWRALYRIGLGGCLLWQVWKYFSAGLIHSYYIEPAHHFTWPGLSFVRPWSESGMYMHFALLAVAAMCILLGFRYRIAATVFFVGYTWLFLIDVCWYLNHYYLICLLSFLAIFLPANRELSIDVLRNPKLRRQWTPSWTLWLLRFQIAIPYVYGGIAKLNSDWLHGEPIRSWLAVQPDFPLIGQFFRDEWCVSVFVYGGMLVDLLIVPLLLWRRTRIPAMLIAIAFHLLNSQLFTIGVFPWLMIWVTVFLFTSPETIAKLRRNRVAQGSSASDSPPTDNRLSIGWTTALAAYVAWQTLMPLRHHFYPGHTAFTNEGHRFSWRMKLNNRTLQPRFFYTDSATGRRHALALHHWITWFQERKLEDADQLLQLTDWIEADLKQKGVINPRIAVEATVALNGRPPMQFVDPDLDLTKIDRTFAPTSWITQYPNPLSLADWPRNEKP